MKIKAGYRTSEFWFTLVSFIFSGLFLMGIIGDYSHKEELIRNISHGVESVILISGQLFVLYRYVNGRNQIKRIAEEELEKIKRVPSTPKTKVSTPKKPRKPRNITPKKGNKNDNS